MNENVQNLANALIPEEYKEHKFYCVMMFYRNGELGIPADVADPNQWTNTRNVTFQDHQVALDCYANTPCPASQLIEADTLEELKKKQKEMVKNFQNPKWLEEVLYPCL